MTNCRYYFLTLLTKFFASLSQFSPVGRNFFCMDRRLFSRPPSFIADTNFLKKPTNRTFWIPQGPWNIVDAGENYPFPHRYFRLCVSLSNKILPFYFTSVPLATSSFLVLRSASNYN